MNFLGKLANEFKGKIPLLNHSADVSACWAIEEE